MISYSNGRKQHQRRFGQEIDAVEVFNQLNSAIVRLPEYPRAIDTLQRHLPLLKKMQCLLSQRPRRGGDEGFTKPNYIRGKPIRIAREVTKAEEIPSWSSWIHAYSQAIGFSVRHIQRLMFDPGARSLPRKTPRKTPISEKETTRDMYQVFGGSFRRNLLCIPRYGTSRSEPSRI